MNWLGFRFSSLHLFFCARLTLKLIYLFLLHPLHLITQKTLHSRFAHPNTPKCFAKFRQADQQGLTPANARKIPKDTRHIIFPWNRGTVSILVHPLSHIVHDTDCHYMHPLSSDIHNQKCQASQLSADSTYFLWLLWAVLTRQEFWVCLGELTPDPKLGAPLLWV